MANDQKTTRHLSSKERLATTTSSAAVPASAHPRSLHKRTRIAAFGLTLSAFASIAFVVGPPWLDGLALSQWPLAILLLIAGLIVTPLALALVWWPRRYAVDLAIARRPDSEHEQATIRMVLGGAALLYLSGTNHLLGHDNGLGDGYFGVGGLELAADAMAWGLCVGWLALLHIVVSPAQSTIRRGAMAVVDLLVLSFMLAVGGGPASVLFPIYLWVTFGNGFRYGVGFLVFSATISALGFGATIVTSSYWSDNAFVAYGLLVSLIVLPAYVSTLIRKLNRARAQAEEASQAKSRFLATMSHELRTPLTAVISTGDLLETTALDADQRSMIGTVQTSAKALLSLINEILDLSRIEAGKQNLDLDDIDLSQVVSSVWRMLHTQAEQKGLRLRVTLDARLRSKVRGDTKRLMQILVNLVGNAIKFTGEGEVEISARLFEHKGRRDWVLFSVRDTGIGVPADKLGTIFEGFTQADDAINRRYGGTGLGLTITRQLVEMMGGEIEVSSQEGQGSRFDLTIPFEVVSAGRDPGMLDTETASEPDAAPIPRPAAVPAETVRLESRLPVVVCLPEPVRSEVVAALGQSEVRSVDTIDEAVSAIEEYRSLGHVLVVAAADAGDQLSSQLLRYFEDRRSSDGIALLEVGSGEAAENACRVWPVDVVITVSADSAALGAAQRQSAYFYSAGLSGATGDEAVGGQDAVNAYPGRRILLVDDNRTNRRVISRVLENAGHQVETAENGDDALDRLDVESFDIVLTDINMPGTSGLDLTKMYRVLHADEPHMPIVALTADATDQAKQDCRDAGMDGYLTKPVEAQQLLAMVRELTPGADAVEQPCQDVPRASAGPMTAGEPEHFDVGNPHEASEFSKSRVQLITPISSHPKYGGVSSEPVLDPDAVDSLRALDPDRAFMAEVFGDFLSDAETTLVSLNQAFDRGDLAMFHDEAHALRSSAGYVGAKRMVRLLLDMRGVGPDRDNKRSRELLAELDREFEMVRAAVGRELSEDRRATPL